MKRSSRPRVLRFDSDKGPQLRLLMRDRIIGHYSHRLQRWQVRFPYRLFVNERSLPTPHPRESNEQDSHDER